MKIQASIIALALAAAMAAASAQNYKWVDKDGKVRYGDTPPTGAKTTRLKPPPGPAAPAAGSAAAKDAKKGPLTPAEQDQAFRKRQLDAKAAEEKAQKTQKEAAEKVENCANARESLAALESGQRIARTDDKGERYFVDDAQRERDIARGREMVKKACE